MGSNTKYLAKNMPSGKIPSKIHNDYSLLSGFIYCEKHGGRMFAKQRFGKNENSELFDYMCNSKLHSEKPYVNVRI